MTLPKAVTATVERERLDAFYSGAGLLTNDGRDCPSYPKCRASCASAGCELTPPTGACVGERYEENRLLFVGINTNEGSPSSAKFYSSYDWFSGRKTERGAGIGGAVHRLTSKVLGKPDLRASESQQFMAFSNVIKCSVNVRAGTPTQVMRDMCVVRHGYLFREIDLLQPRVVIALGSPPYEALHNHYIEVRHPVAAEFADWMFSVEVGGKAMLVLGLYNPGQGYREPRRIWKQIREKGLMPRKWSQFLPKGVSTADQLKAYLDRQYEGKRLVDQPNPYYEMVVDKLLVEAIAWQGSQPGR